MFTFDDRLGLIIEKAPKWMKSQDWGGLYSRLLLPTLLPKIKNGGNVIDCDPVRLLNCVGSLLAELLLSTGKNEQDIMSTENQLLVLQIVNSVLIVLSKAGLSVVDSSRLKDIIVEVMGGYTSQLVGDAFSIYSFKRKQRELVENQLYVIRRNGTRVKWEPGKIYKAVLKSFIAWELDHGRDIEEFVPEHIIGNATAITQRAVYKVTGLGKDIIHIEDIQDCVEDAIESYGFVELRQIYAQYRKKRAEVRAKQFIDEHSVYFSDFIDHGLVSRIEFAVTGLTLDLSREELLKRLIHSMEIGMTAGQIAQTVILNARMLMERDSDYRFFVARILLSYIYEEVLDWKVEDGIHQLRSAHEKGFRKFIEKGIQDRTLDARMNDFDLTLLASKINPLADLRFDYLGIFSLYDRYLIRQRHYDGSRSVMFDKSERKIIEVPQFMWMRVAMGLCIQENNKNDQACAFYSLYSLKKFCSSTPTLFNSGTVHNQLSSCYGLTCPDEIASISFDKNSRPHPTGIFGIYTECALISKFAGGLGVDFTPVRGKGSTIVGTNGDSLGVIPFLRILNDVAIAVNQGGKRRGVICAYLETWHNDIEDFLDLRKNTGDDRRRTHDLHTANWVPDLFIKRAINGQDWTLFRSNEVKDLHDLYGQAFEERYVYYENLAKEGKIYGRVIRSGVLWKKMLEALFETGHPWITFKDPSNIRSPQDHVGVVHCLNLCTEIVLNNSVDEHFVCNLGSLFLPSFVDKDTKTILWDQLAESVHIAIRMLDNVIDINFYPTIPSENANKKHRPVGLGMMGWQDVLHMLSIPFDSEEMVDLADKMTEFIAWHAMYASVSLAKEKGAYESFKGSKWDRGLFHLETLDLLEKERGVKVDVSRTSSMDWETLKKMVAQYGLRNSTLLAIAPNATISMIFGCSPCIEPDFRHIFSKSSLSGEQIWLNPHLVEHLKQKGMWNKQVLDELKYFKGDLTNMDCIDDKTKRQFQTAFNIDSMWLIKAAAVRQKWVDQAISLNLFLNRPDMKSISYIYLQAWLRGLKSTYYFKTKSASDIEDATLSVKKKTLENSSVQKGYNQVCNLSGGLCESCE